MVTNEAVATLENEINSCTRCGLHEYRSRGVPGEGPYDADIVVIGEAPGTRENALGQPFVGPTGKLLSTLFVHAGISRQDVFITNMVKCWPGPGNPDPSPDDVGACSRFLDRQLGWIQPRGILTVGRISTAKFIEIPKGGLGSIRGAIRPANLEWGLTYVMPIYHPSFLYREQARSMEHELYAETVAHLENFAEVVYETHFN